ncbi:putative reverse transcriptase domain-containing protein [Tanacetum coccineum]
MQAGNRKIRIHLCYVDRDGTITRVPGQFQGYETSKEEPLEQPRRHDLYGFDEDEVGLRLESTASSEPVWEKTTKDDHDRPSRNAHGWWTSRRLHGFMKMAPNRRSGPSSSNNNENPDIATLIAQQLQAIITQSAKWKGGDSLTRVGFEKMENVIDNSGCAENQKVRYATSSLVNKALTWWNTQCQARGRVAAMAISWNDFKPSCMKNFAQVMKWKSWRMILNHKMMGANHAAYTDRFHVLAKLVPHLVTPESSRIKRYIAGLAPEIRGMLWATQPTTIQTVILRAGILTDKAVSCGTLTENSDKRKGVEEPSKTGGS